MSKGNMERGSYAGYRKRGALSLRTKMVVGFGLLSVAILVLLQVAHQFGVPFTGFQGEYQQHQNLALLHMNCYECCQGQEVDFQLRGIWWSTDTPGARRPVELQSNLTLTGTRAGGK